MAKSEQFYDVTIRTDVERMQTILQVVKGSATLIGVVPVTVGSPEVVVHKKNMRYVDGRKKQGHKCS